MHSKLVQNPEAYFCIAVGPVSKHLQVSIILGILDKKLTYSIIALSQENLSMELSKRISQLLIFLICEAHSQSNLILAISGKMERFYTVFNLVL